MAIHIKHYCPAPGCYRSGDSLGDCGRAVTPCPKPKQATASDGVAIRCSSCAKSWVLPIDTLAKGKAPKLTCCKQQKLTFIPLPKKAKAPATNGKEG